jgi:hypothetical protein
VPIHKNVARKPKTSTVPLNQEIMRIRQAKRELNERLTALKTRKLPSRSNIRSEKRETVLRRSSGKLLRFHDQRKSRKRGPNRPWPTQKIARLWEKGWSIARIAEAIDRVDSSASDPFHSLRNKLHRMHSGYRTESGELKKLPHRVEKSTLRLAAAAGRRAW